MIMQQQQQQSQSSGGRVWRISAIVTMILAIVGAVPTAIDLYQAWVLGIKWGQVPFAVQQRELWEKNLMCATKPGQEIQTEQQIVVRIQACESGDVLVTAFPPGVDGRSVWMPAEGFQASASAFGLFGAALAQDAPQTGQSTQIRAFSVQCQEWAEGGPSSGLLIRIVTEGNVCFKEQVNIFTGAITLREEAACNAACTVATQ
jgi:hypothetical protein